MTESEKALELFNKMYDYQVYHQSEFEQHFLIDKAKAKECALIAVDEILRIYRKGSVDSKYTKGFWGGVKQKLKEL